MDKTSQLKIRLEGSMISIDVKNWPYFGKCIYMQLVSSYKNGWEQQAITSGAKVVDLRLQFETEVGTGTLVP